MKRLSSIGLLLLSAVFVVGLSFPRPAEALGLSFGGRVLIMKPCHIGLMPTIWVQIIPAGTFIGPPYIYIWTPATLTFLSGPPTHPGQEILGVADTPIVCFIGVYPLPPGLRMQIVGTSPL